ncbi:hypothetical protein ASE37_22195 [Rhizobium sp. Root268]|nr:hypothetical protein ASC86_23625 [Rhizobium sp. Root1212]KRD34977.1 hypothetical protein ASE37_22195 [Rhizobium sp. Root268]
MARCSKAARFCEPAMSLALREAAVASDEVLPAVDSQLRAIISILAEMIAETRLGFAEAEL